MSHINDYFAGLQALIADLDYARVDRLTDLLHEAWSDGKNVLIFGNGGSAASASHIVNDLQKCIYLDSGKPIRALCLSDNTPLVLAWGNDTDFSNIYAPQIECWAGPGDLAIGISGSGNSPNIIRAVEAANARGARTFGLAGYGGGELARVAKESLVLQTHNMQHIEDIHMAVLHGVFSALRERTRRA